MANLRTAPSRAEHVRTEREAAKMYNDLEYELAMGEHNHDDETSGEDALGVLRGRFPGVEEAARDITDPPRLSRKASRNVYGHEGRSHRPSSQPGESAPRPRTPPRPAQSTPRRSTSGVSPRRAARQTVRLTSIGAGAVTGATGWGSLILEMALGGVLLSLAYLLLSHPQGPARLATGSSNLIRAVVGVNVDPLNPTSKGAR